MPRMTLRLLPPLAGLTFLTACATAPVYEPAPVPVSKIVNPCDAITLPNRLDADQRGRLVRELSEAPADAQWPGSLMAASAVVEAVRACQSVK